MSPAERAAAARAAFQPLAERLGEQVSTGSSRFEPGKGLTALGEWFIDDEHGLLVLVVGAHQALEAVDSGFAYALAWQQDRDLVLVVPETHAGAILARLPWIETPVRVFTYGAGHEARPAVVPARAEVLAAAATGPLRDAEVHDLVVPGGMLSPTDAVRAASGAPPTSLTVAG